MFRKGEAIKFLDEEIEGRCFGIFLRKATDTLATIAVDGKERYVKLALIEPIERGDIDSKWKHWTFADKLPSVEQIKNEFNKRGDRDYSINPDLEYKLAYSNGLTKTHLNSD